MDNVPSKRRTLVLRRRWQDQATRRDLARVHRAIGNTGCAARRDHHHGRDQESVGNDNSLRRRTRETGNVDTLDRGPTRNRQTRGERNGHRPLTHKTDTPTGNVCTTSQYDKSTGTQPSASVHTITQYSQRRARLMVPNRRPLSVGRYTAWPAVSVGDDVFICNYHIHTHPHISPPSLSSFTTRSIRQFMTLQWNSLHRTPIETS